MAENKRWAEIVLMPLVIALVGVFGTYFVTRQQQEAAKELRQAEIESARELAASEHRIKMLDVFNERLFSSNDSERILGLRLLESMDPTFAQRLANIVAADEPEGSIVKKVANEVIADVVQRGYSFPTVGSFMDFRRAIKFANQIRESALIKYEPHVYRDPSGWHIVSLGGYLTRDEAQKRVNEAKEKGIAEDAFVWTSRLMGENIYR